MGKFKKGDKVKIIKNYKGTAPLATAGKIGKIVNTVAGKPPIKVKLRGRENYWFYYAKELRHFSGDDLTKTKQDRKRIALTQPHERAYMKKIAKEMLYKLEIDKKDKYCGGYFSLNAKDGCEYKVRTDKLMRICKALIKVLK